MTRRSADEKKGDGAVEAPIPGGAAEVAGAALGGTGPGAGTGLRPGGSAPVLSRRQLKAVIFDMDGVVTKTASVHNAAWTRLFNDYLEQRARTTGTTFVPFDPDEDYRRYIDGKARYDGVRDFLGSREITLPEGTSSDPPDAATVRGLGNRKDEYFLTHIRDHGVEPYESTLALVGRLKEQGFGTAIISASRNMDEVLRAAGIGLLFDARVDGRDAENLRIPGKPDPAVFLEAARRLAVDPGRAAVIEDALAGVAAGRRGRFGLVVGVDRTGHADALRAAGADVVVRDLGELRVEE